MITQDMSIYLLKLMPFYFHILFVSPNHANTNLCYGYTELVRERASEWVTTYWRTVYLQCQAEVWHWCDWKFSNDLMRDLNSFVLVFVFPVAFLFVCLFVCLFFFTVKVGIGLIEEKCMAFPRPHSVAPLFGEFRVLPGKKSFANYSHGKSSCCVFFRQW